VLATAAAKTDRLSRRVIGLRERIGYGKTLVAIAAKNARMVWAMRAKGNEFKLLTCVAGPCRPSG